MAAPAAVVELGRATEFGADRDKRFVEKSQSFQIANQRGQCPVEFLDQNVLIELPLEVRVPAGAVDEVEVVGNLDKANSGLRETTREQTALTELAAIVRSLFSRQ